MLYTCIYLHNCKLNNVQEKARVETTQRDSWTSRRGSLTSYLKRQSGTWKCLASICYSSDLFLSPVRLSVNSGKKPKMKLISNVYLLYPSRTHNIILKSSLTHRLAMCEYVSSNRESMLNYLVISYNFHQAS